MFDRIIFKKIEHTQPSLCIDCKKQTMQRVFYERLYGRESH